ncbi:aminopeptidase N [Amycolatopsis pigmentata]|uniref:Aminopeptidase N n=1 Tax=Amycolatopsis pigmentata TaxID=450801 RepID=A0ABW5FYF7_9PSEU
MNPAGSAGAPGHPAGHEAAARSRLISHVRYHVVLDLTRPGDEFRCGATIRFRAGAGNTLTFLDYAGTAQLIECNGSAVGTVAQHGARIYLPVVVGENVVRVVGTAPYRRDGAGLHRFRDPVDGQSYLHTRFALFDAHRVYPCFDQPDLKAALELSVTVDDRWHVITNTEPTSVPKRFSNGTAVWTFARTPPLPPHLTVLVAGPFRRITTTHGDLPLALYAREALFDALGNDADELFEVITRGLDFSADLLDRPYPFAKYDHVFSPECAFSTAPHPGCVVCDERFLFRSGVTRETRRRRAEALLSAMAHMWFGGLVTLRWWNGLWLHEGVATLIAALAQPEATPFGEAWALFEHEVCSVARQADRLPHNHPITPGAGAAHLGADPIMAKKAAAVLRQLAVRVGWENFLAGLRRYLRDHAWSAADTGDLIRVLESAAAPGLTGWAAEWLRRPGVDTVEVHRLPTGGTVTHLSDPQARRVRLRVGCYSEALRLQHRRWVNPDHQGARENDGDGTRQVCDVVLPNDDGHVYVKIRLDPASRRTVMSRISALSDPVTRAVAWGTLWDSVLDARIPARAFVAVVLDHAPAEEDVGVLGLLWQRAITAARVFGARSNRAASLRRIARRIREELDASSAGGDRLLTLAHALTSSISGEDALLHDIAWGRRPWPGLEVDRDLRWRALLHLAVQGKPVDELLAALLPAEPGDDDRRRALTVEAARPDSRAKSQAWHRMFSDAYSLVERQAVMAGFHRHGQEHVLTPYAERYFLALDHVWHSMSPENALAMVRTLYPLVTDAEQEVLARTDETVAQRALPAEVLRVLRRKRAELAFMLAARACDAARPRSG